MIHLITLNPAIDEYIELNQLQLGMTHYRNNTNYKLGGKGINVAIVLNNLGCEYRLITTTNSNNKFATEHYKRLNCQLFDHGYIRTNLKLIVESEITEVNDRGQQLPEAGKQFFRDYVNSHIQADDYVLIAGNPHSSDEQFQFELAQLCKSKTNNLIIDSNRFDFLMIMEVKPLLIKPNQQELMDLLPNEEEHVRISQVLQYCSELLVSRGAQGLSYYKDGGCINLPGAKGEVINTVGAGDSVVAAYLYSKTMQFDDEQLAKFCLATANASVFHSQLATVKNIRKYFPEI